MAPITWAGRAWTTRAVRASKRRSAGWTFSEAASCGGGGTVRDALGHRRRCSGCVDKVDSCNYTCGATILRIAAPFACSTRSQQVLTSVRICQSVTVCSKGCEVKEVKQGQKEGKEGMEAKEAKEVKKEVKEKKEEKKEGKKEKKEVR